MNSCPHVQKKSFSLLLNFVQLVYFAVPNSISSGTPKDSPQPSASSFPMSLDRLESWSEQRSSGSVFKPYPQYSPLPYHSTPAGDTLAGVRSSMYDPYSEYGSEPFRFSLDYRSPGEPYRSPVPSSGKSHQSICHGVCTKMQEDLNTMKQELANKDATISKLVADVSQLKKAYKVFVLFLTYKRRPYCTRPSISVGICVHTRLSLVFKFINGYIFQIRWWM